MRLLRSILPADRHLTGSMELVGACSSIEAGPWECYGKADNGRAAAHGNPGRDPRMPYGDHPTGNYTPTALIETPTDDQILLERFGPARIVLDPIDGPAYAAKINGRYGLLIHGGRLGAGEVLRATYGCLRVHDETMEELVTLWRDEPFAAYQCLVL